MAIKVIGSDGREVKGAALDAWKKKHGAVGSDGRPLVGAAWEAWARAHPNLGGYRLQ